MTNPHAYAERFRSFLHSQVCGLASSGSAQAAPQTALSDDEKAGGSRTVALRKSATMRTSFSMGDRSASFLARSRDMLLGTRSVSSAGIVPVELGSDGTRAHHRKGGSHLRRLSVEDHVSGGSGSAKGSPRRHRTAQHDDEDDEGGRRRCACVAR